MVYTERTGGLQTIISQPSGILALQGGEDVNQYTLQAHVMTLEESIRELEERLGMSQSEEVGGTGRMVALLQD